MARRNGLRREVVKQRMQKRRMSEASRMVNAAVGELRLVGMREGAFDGGRGVIVSGSVSMSMSIAIKELYSVDDG